MTQNRFNRRALLRAGAGTGAAAGVAAVSLPLVLPRGAATAGGDHAGHSQAAMTQEDATDHPDHGAAMTVGEVDVARLGWDPSAVLTDFDYGEVIEVRPDGTAVREWDIVAFDREIEIAPGVFFPAWTYNGRVPGPTLRANEGDLLRVHFTNAGSHPHTMHFHGIHSAYHDGVTGIGRGEIEVGGQHTYEFTAKPFGLHLYHCHATPLKRHIHKGLYGTFIINPDPAKRGDAAKTRRPDFEESRPWQELVMVMNAFDTTFDSENEVYAVNTVAFHYMKHPIVIDKSRPVRIYLVNVVEFDPINSFHLHANFFDYYDTGTNLEPTLRTVDTISQVQAQRGILEFTFDEHEPGLYMFHAHVTEFTELGWMGVFDVREPGQVV
jgi:FtsP/CotA-like multicopper oxidase with cupredoxin domain